MHGKILFGPDREDSRKYVFGARDDLNGIDLRLRTVSDGSFRYIRNKTPHISFTEIIPAWNEICHTWLAQMRKLHMEGRLSPAQDMLFSENLPTEELYDLENDPYELHNLAGYPEFKNQLKRLRRQLAQWSKSTGDRGGKPLTPELKTWWQSWHSNLKANYMDHARAVEQNNGYVPPFEDIEKIP